MPVSFLRTRIPVQDDRDGRNAGAFNWDIDQKPLAIRENGVLRSLLSRGFTNVSGKQLDRRAGFKRLAIGCHLDGGGHQLAIGCDVEKFLSVTVPSGFVPPAFETCDLPPG